MVIGEVIKGYNESEEYGRYVQSMAAEIQRDKITFLGRIDFMEIEKYYLLADIAVIPSIVDEGLGNIAIEAMASGMPVITSGRGGQAELVIHETNGLIVSEIENTKELSDVIQKLLDNSDYRTLLGKNGSDFVKDKFRWEDIVRHQENTYKYLTERKNILFYDPSSGYGGSSKVLAGLVNNIDHKRYAPFVVVKRYGPNFSKIKDAEFIKLKFYDEEQKVSSLGLIQSFLTEIIPEAIKLYFLIKNKKISMVHINITILWGIPAIIAARLANIPCLCHVHYTPGSFINREKLFIRWVSKIIAINKAAYDICRNYMPEYKLELVYNGIDMDEIANVSKGAFRREFNLDGAPLIGLVGRVVRGKGHAEFVLSGREVLKEVPKVKLFIIGDTKGEEGSEAYLKEIQALIRKERLEKDIIFTGWRNDVNSVISDLDILVQASTTFPEGLSGVLLEAMALEKPVIATRISGSTDVVIDGETGFLVNPGDVMEMAEKIVYLLTNPVEAKSMGNRGKRRVEDYFNIRITTQRIEDIYSGLLLKEDTSYVS
jgi:glycosyltransferase involved in cell wall biosynthesis